MLGKRGHITFTRSELVALLIAIFVGIPLFLPVIVLFSLLDHFKVADFISPLVARLICIIVTIAWWSILCTLLGWFPLLIMIGLMAFAWALVGFKY